MQKKTSKKDAANIIAAKLAAFNASQQFKLSQSSPFKPNTHMGPMVKRAKKRGDR